MKNNVYNPRAKRLKVTRALLIIAWIILLAILAALGFYFVKMAKENTKSDAIIAEKSYIRSNLLAVISDNEYDTPPATVLLGFDGEKSIIKVAVFNDEMILGAAGFDGTLAEHYKYGGVKQVKNALEEYAGIKIDHYMDMGCNLFETATATLGAVEYDVDEEMYRESDDGVVLCDIKKGEQSFVGAQFAEYFRFDGYKGEERSEKLLAMAVQMIDQYSNDAQKKEIVGAFQSIASDLVTDLSVIDAGELQNEYDRFLMLKNTAYPVKDHSPDMIKKEFLFEK